MIKRLWQRGLYWPLLIVTLLCITVGYSVALFVSAANDPTFAIERNYYQKALSWDATAAQAQRNNELGWQAAVSLVARDESGHARFAVRLTDAQGAPIAGAEVSAEAFAIARSTDVQQATASPAPGVVGTYILALARARLGLWEVRVVAKRGDDVFTHSARIELGATAGPSTAATTPARVQP